MELILISNTKLKIMLNESDMRQYRISEEADCAEPDTRRAIRNLLEKAREQIGFNTEGSEIFVQLYTSRKGGCELFITKTSLEEPAQRAKEEIKSSVKASEKKPKRQSSLPEKPLPERDVQQVLQSAEAKKQKPRLQEGGRIAFSFPDVRSLCKVCKILKDSGVTPKSRAFADGDGNCYLLLLNTGLSAYARLDKLTFILEYGKRENPDCLSSYISEHGKEICSQNAIETLCKL
jgi:negative regulator of genetic competence, sporulation and motility